MSTQMSGPEPATPKLDAAARELRSAYAGAPLQPLRDVLAPTDGDGAYAVQEINTRFWQQQGRRIVGRKIGLTAAAVQRQLGVDQPDYGVLFDDMRIDDGGVLRASKVIQPKAEAEIALVLAADIVDSAVDEKAIAAATDHAVAAIEIVDSRIADWKITFADTVADNGSSAFFVLGRRERALDGLDLYSCGMVLEVNGAVASLGAGVALAAGCAAIAVPSLETPFSALALAALADEAGIPPGVLSVLTGDPATLVGRLCESEVVRGLSFTGSTAIGRLLFAQCASTVKRVSLELGGHAPFIAFPDCDIEQAAAAAVAAKFQTSGQDCLAANRIYVHASIKEDFVAAFVRQTEELRIGSGFDPGVELGPLINQRTLEKSLEHIADAVERGARLMTGGERHPCGDLFLAPTVLADVTPEMKVASEETFGPVAGILSFDDEEAVIRAANSTEYGLAAYVFTRDIARAMRMTDALEYGMVGVNTIKITGAPIPFGGIKQSGLGREGSLHGIDEYLERKYVCIGI
jgi:2-keto-4-pentenoate hydratase